MTRQDKAIAYILIFQAVVAAATVGWLTTRNALPATVWVIFAPLIAGALIAGVASLGQRRWGLVLGMIVFAIQIPIIATPSFQFYAWLGLHLDLALTWQGHSKIGINGFALAMLIWSAVRYCAPNNSVRDFPSTPGA